MAITHYKTVFSEYHCGPTSFIHMLSKPIAAMRDVDIHQNDVDKLQDAIAKSEKNTNTTLFFLRQS